MFIHLTRDAVQLFVYGGDFDTKDGTGCRDYIHIMDIARGHVAALKQVNCPRHIHISLNS